MRRWLVKFKREKIKNFALKWKGFKINTLSKSAQVLLREFCLQGLYVFSKQNISYFFFFFNKKFSLMFNFNFST